MLSTMTIAATVSQVRPIVEAQREQIFTDLTEITGFNSVHATPELAASHHAAAEWVRRSFSELGLAVTAYAEESGSPVFICTKPAVGNAPTVLLYSHYDVVPAGDLSNWKSDPFTLTERDGRWYARGAADCKGNLVMHLAALRAVNELGGTDLGIKVVVEGSEEQGGAQLDELIKTQPELFQADVIFIADSGNTSVGVPTLTTSLRGVVDIEVSVDTLKAPAHSGAFGGAAPDATAALIRLLDTFKDEHGRTVIDGIDCTGTWHGSAYDRETFRRDAGMLDGVAIMGTEEDDPFDMLLARPAISITGFSSTPVEQAVNAVPPTAAAHLNVRIPAGQDAREVAQAIVNQLHNRAPWGVKVSTTIIETSQPFSTDTDGAGIKHFTQCLSQAYGNKEVVITGTGGSIPMCSVLNQAVPGAELTLFGVEEPQSTIHSPNESVDPNEIRDIAIAEASFLLSYR